MHPQLYEASLSVAVAASLGTYVALKARPSPGKRLMLALQGAMLVWSGGVAASRLGLWPELELVAARLAFAGIFALPPLWLLLTAELSGRRWAARREVRLCVAAPSAGMLVVLATNPLHGALFARPEALLDGPPAVWAGPLFWPWVTWAYTLILAGSAVYAHWSWQLVGQAARWRGLILCVASGAPLLGSVAHVLGWIPQLYDPTPLLLGGATLLLFLADWRYRLLDAVPVARRDVIEQLRDGVVLTDAAGCILDMNPAAERQVGARLEGLAGLPLARMIAMQAEGRFEFDEAAFNEAVVDMCRSPGGFETHVENFAGERYEVRGASVVDAAGRSSGLYLIMREVTEAARYEAALHQSRRAHAIAGLAGGVAHEVNNPLAYIRSNVGLVLGALRSGEAVKPAEREELEAALEESLDGIDRISAIVEGVRRFTRGQGVLREMIPVAELLDEALRIRGLLGRAGVEIVREVEEGLAPAYGTRDLLLEALLNLLENAEQALGDEGGRIAVRARSVEGALWLEVEDDGPGVPAELRERILEPFFTTRDGGAVGLGLALAAKLVSDLGGGLSCEAPQSTGARFVIRLPLANAGGA